MSLLDARLNSDDNTKPEITAKKTKKNKDTVKTKSTKASIVEKESPSKEEKQVRPADNKSGSEETKATIDDKASVKTRPIQLNNNSEKKKLSREELRQMLNIVMKVHHELVNDPAFGRQDFDVDANSDGMDIMKKSIEKKVIEIMDKLGIRLPKAETDEVIKSVIHETIGLGPLEKLTCDESITEIMTNGHDMVFIEQSGKVKLSDVIFYDEDHLRRIITKIVSKVGRRVDETSPLVDARLLDGSRVNAVIPPIAVKGVSSTKIL